ncbi:MAG: hypothetical protein CL607_28260 [Anaerolineaceae bacterium]|nr:hypothetical protein [Anaerolineaceae bacterium]
MTHIAYYVSGHGFGHAARQQPIIKRLSDLCLTIHVRTSAPQKFFQAPNVVYHHQQYDIGTVQINAMRLDAQATFQWYADFLQNRQEALIAAEVAYLRQHDIRLVVTDIPPVACEIAAAAGIPCVVVTHFTWDWVYEHYINAYPQYSYIVDSITASYHKADLLLEMPFAHPMPQFDHIEKIPLVANPLTQTRQQVRDAFDVPDEHKLAVISMGGMDWAGGLDAIQHKAGWTFIVTPAAWEQVKDWPHTRLVGYGHGEFQNILAAADLSIGKSGYSTMSEVIVHQTPMLFLTRENWREHDLLAAAMRKYNHSIEITHQQYEQGDWIHWIDELAAREGSLPTLPTNGADVAAQKLFDLANR